MSVEVSVRERLGGRRAISWQAVVVGDLLIVVLATTLAALTARDRRPIDAAIDIFAITMATAVVVAAYAGIIHLTVFRNRARSPVPVPIAIGFHVSIGGIFLIGFFVGAAFLGIPPLGDSPTFAVGVLSGGLLVCIPTSLLLDHSDRYRTKRQKLIHELAELERLRISEWSLRQALRSLSSHIDDRSISEEINERLDTLNLSEGTRLSTKQLWQTSRRHHQGDASSESVLPRHLSESIYEQLAREYPPVTWMSDWKHAPRHLQRFPLASAVSSAFMVWLFLTWFAPTVVAIAVGLTAAVGVNGINRFVPPKERRLVPPMIAVWTGLAAVVWSQLLWVPMGATVLNIVGALFATITAVCVACLVSAWVGAVVDARGEQQQSLQFQIERRREESAAVFASLIGIITKMTAVPPLAGSAAMAACATGLQRVQRETDTGNARRIIDWTESVITAPGVLTPLSLEGRIENVVHPWRALADITVDCPEGGISPSLVDDIVAVLDEAVKNACRHGDARTITATVSADFHSRVRIEVLDDGVGFQPSPGGVGFERFAILGTHSFEVTPRDPGPGTRLLVVLKDPAAIGV